MNKFDLISKIISHLQSELLLSEIAATNAHLAATDEQSKAETQYDTLAIESAYLAEGQSRRITEFKSSIQQFELLIKQLELTRNNTSAKVNVGSLVQLCEDIATKHWYFIAPAAGGFKTHIADYCVTLVTPHSPMGQALMNKEIDDEITINLGAHTLIDDLSCIL